MTNNKYKHLDEEQRNIIEHMLNNNKNFSQIENVLKVDRTTISKEIRKNYFIRVSEYSKTVCENQINCGVSFCRYNKDCFKSKVCEKLMKPPYVCNACSKKANCRYPKRYYFANIAQKKYAERLSESKKGYDITEEDVSQIERIIVPLVKEKKQPISHIYNNHQDILFFSKPTFYRYVDEGVISLSNIDLPKKVSYKPRKNQETITARKLKTYCKNRTYDDYLKYIEKHPKCSVVEMDTVEGIKGGKCFLTLFVKKTSLLLIFLIDSKTQEEVEKVFAILKQKLGIQLYRKIFQVILTDNGSEFLNPIIFERDLESGKKISKVFYCDPYSSWQKSSIERSHEAIRIPLPKGTSFNHLTNEQTKKLQDNIANTYHSKIKKTPYLETKRVFPELIVCLEINFIAADEVNFSKSHLKEVSHDDRNNIN